MTVLDDLVSAVQAYPRESLTLAIVEVDPDGPGDAINENEEVTFRIEVTNTGPLDVHDLSVKVEGLHGTQVRNQGAGSQFEDDFTATNQGFELIPANRPRTPVVSTGSKYTFKPVSASASDVALVQVSVAGWNAEDFHHILNDRSDGDAQAKVTFSAPVSPE